MAAPTLDVSLIEFASTLDPAKAPERLRCPKCPRLLIDAYKTSCCDVIVCGLCFEAANNSCPQCGHSPFNENTAKASSTTRKTLKSWLKDQKTKAEKPPLTPAPEGVTDTSAQPSIDTSQGNVTSGDLAEASESIKESASMSLPAEEQPIPSIEKPEEATELHSDPMDANDDDVEIQVDLDHEDASFALQQDEEDQGQPQEYAAQPTSNDDTIRPESQNDHNSPANPTFDSNGTGMQGMDFGNPMMQNMQMMMNGSFPAMAGMQMGMNPMGNMFGGFGPNGGINGMNMMNFNPQNMFGNFQNSNMWQNNNANAFPNGMGGDFNFGLNSNFNNQQYPNGDFQSGYRGRGYGRGRGRGRGRGGYDRGRGNFYNNFDNRQNFQNGYDQQWNNQQQPQMNGQYQQHEVSKPEHVKEEEPNLDDDEFAPGGQEEVQEALGDDYAKKETKPEEPAPVETPVDEIDQHVGETAGAEPVDIDHLQAHTVDEAPPQDTQPIAEAYSEDLDMVMPPPSAPSGPAGRYGDKDFGFRSRGHGKYPRNRGSIHLSNGRGPSPVRSPSTQTVPRPGSAGQGVVGAPTGPRAMRDPPPKPSRAPSGGFQIMGRASLASRITEQRSPSPPQDNGDGREERSSRHHSRRDEDDDHDRSRKHRRSRRGDEDDYASQDEAESYSRHESQDRSRKSRRERDKHGSRSNKYETTRADEDLDMNDYGEPTDEAEKGGRRDRKHRERERERERDRDRGRDRDRERDSHRDRDRDRAKERDRSRGERDREREERHREKERDRKRRRDRDENDAHDEDVDSSRHKSRRHRKEHTSANNRDDDQLNGRSSHRSSQVATPTATPSKEESEMDPITRERMERDRQRMMKEQQRRENAAATLKGGSSRSGGGARRQMPFKYEDEAERGMIEGERDRHRARWR